MKLAMARFRAFAVFVVWILITDYLPILIQAQGTNVDMEPLTTSTPKSVSCRYWEGSVDKDYYQLTTCGHCYGYLFHTAELKPFRSYLVSLNGTVFPPRSYVLPDRHNGTLVEQICRTIPEAGGCERWLTCCDAAERCCDRQNSVAIINHESLDNERSCPGTWDGFACWDTTPADVVEHQSCPGFIPSAMPARDAFKTCTENGTWFLHNTTQKEWTDYTTCYNYDNIAVVVYVKLACDVISLVALIPSVCIFMAYRQLRNQNRVRLHINLFLSFILYAFVNMIWETCVVYNRIQSKSGGSIMSANSAGCKLLYALTRYSRTANFFWMFCEGLYLHRLIVKAFNPPKELFPFYALGWGAPWIPTGIYCVIRLYVNNESCWVHHIGYFEWIIYTPNLMALVVNFAFLIAILLLLLTQISCHPNEPSNYRRALKATFVLVPLFGIQLFLVIYRPPLESTAGSVYEIISAVVVNTQGFFVALIFCLLNGEVLTVLKRTVSRYGLSGDLSKFTSNTGYTGNTQASELYTKEPSPRSSFKATNSHHANSKDYVAMKPLKT